MGCLAHYRGRRVKVMGLVMSTRPEACKGPLMVKGG
jgi:hypothetical protein